MLQFTLVAERVGAPMFDVLGIAVLYEPTVHWVFYVELGALVLLFLTVGQPFYTLVFANVGIQFLIPPPPSFLDHLGLELRLATFDHA